METARVYGQFEDVELVKVGDRVVIILFAEM